MTLEYIVNSEGNKSLIISLYVDRVSERRADNDLEQKGRCCITITSTKVHTMSNMEVQFFSLNHIIKGKRYITSTCPFTNRFKRVDVYDYISNSLYKSYTLMSL